MINKIQKIRIKVAFKKNYQNKKECAKIDITSEIQFWHFYYIINKKDNVLFDYQF